MEKKAQPPRPWGGVLTADRPAGCAHPGWPPLGNVPELFLRAIARLEAHLLLGGALEERRLDFGLERPERL